MIDQMKLDRSLWRLIAVRCDRCGHVDTFAARMDRAKRHLRETPPGCVWSECGRCGVHEVVRDPAARILLESSA